MVTKLSSIIITLSIMPVNFYKAFLMLEEKKIISGGIDFFPVHFILY